MKGGNYVDGIREIKRVVLDKRGRVREGVLSVEGIWGGEGVWEKEVVEVMGCIESLRNDGMGKGIVKYGEEESIWVKW